MCVNNFLPCGNLSRMAACFTTLGTDEIRSNLACFMDVLGLSVSTGLHTRIHIHIRTFGCPTTF